MVQGGKGIQGIQVLLKFLKGMPPASAIFADLPGGP